MERKIVIHRHGSSQHQGGNIKDILKTEKYLNEYDLYTFAKSDVNLKIITQGGLKFLQDNIVKD